MVTACTVIPDVKDGTVASVGESGKQDSGFISPTDDGGGDFDITGLNRYNEDISIYFAGIQSYKFTPTLTPNWGVTSFVSIDGKTYYHLNVNAMKYFRVMNLARRNGLPPYTGK